MRADNISHLTKAARSRAEQTRRRALTTLRQLTNSEQPLTVSTLAQRAGVSRSWLYTQADLLAQIRDERPRPATRTTVPARQSASDASLKQRLHLAHGRIRELETDNQQLRHALAQALGDERARHARAPHETRP
jgi:AraC-like DNA-binding protein